MPKKNLTYKFIEGLSAPETPTSYYDKGESGLILRVSKAGTKTFTYRYRYYGKNRRYKIGTFPNVSLAEARTEVQNLKADINRGNDPQGERKAKKAAPQPKTINDLADEFKKRHFPKLKESTVSSYRARIDAEILPAFGNMLIENLTRGDIIAFLERIAFEDDKPVHSNRVRNVFSRMFSFGVEKGIAEYNPVSTVKPVGEESSRKRVYSEDEIIALWEAFEAQAEPVQSVLKMLLICGQRKGETCKMCWDKIEGDVWEIPDDITKNGRTHYVPLPGMAIQILEGLPKRNKYVFPSRKNEGEPIRWISGAADRVKELSGIDDFRMHDLRRTAASGMAKLGVDRTVLGKVLNHKGLAGDSQVTAIYDRYEYLEEKEQALQRWSAHLQKVLSGDTEANVTKIG